MVIGLTGYNASGKGIAAQYLQRKGYRPHSLSDVLRAEAKILGRDEKRETLIELGNALRKQFGPGALAKRILPRLGKKDVVDSIRNPGEIEELRKLEGFLLIGVDAPVAVRFKRAVERGRAGDAATLEQFVEHENLENLKDPANQQLGECLKLADAVLVNDGRPEDLFAKIDALLESKKEKKWQKNIS